MDWWDSLNATWRSIHLESISAVRCGADTEVSSRTLERSIPMSVGIENLKAGIVSAISIVCQGIHLGKKVGVILAEAKDVDVSEGIALIVLVATEEGPKIIEALKA
jgi:hypothetical protein